MRLGDILKSRIQGDSTPTEESPLLNNSDTSWREEVRSLSISKIQRSPYQPRLQFDEQQLQELASSIREHGILHPVLVRPKESGYELVVGERRLRACTLLGWESIPAIVREMSDGEAAEIALIENVQREGLSFFEEAEGYRRLLSEFGLTQEELAERVGKTQSAIANKLRLLRFSPEIRERISREMLSERHARALLRLDNEDTQMKALDVIVENGLNVRQTEEWINEYLKQAGSPPEKRKQRSVKGVYKDHRLLVNSVRQLVNQMTKGGIPVELAEEEKDDHFEIRIRVPKGN